MEHLGYGTHLLIDGYDGNLTTLASTTTLETFLREVATILEPQKTPALTICKLEQPAGISALCSLPESHVSMHTFSELGSLAFSAFTRYQLSLEALSNLLNDTFQLKRLEQHLTNHSKVMSLEAAERQSVMVGDRLYSHLRLATIFRVAEVR